MFIVFNAAKIEELLCQRNIFLQMHKLIHNDLAGKNFTLSNSNENSFPRLFPPRTVRGRGYEDSPNKASTVDLISTGKRSIPRNDGNENNQTQSAKSASVE